MTYLKLWKHDSSTSTTEASSATTTEKYDGHQILGKVLNGEPQWYITSSSASPHRTSIQTRARTVARAPTVARGRTTTKRTINPHTSERIVDYYRNLNVQLRIFQGQSIVSLKNLCKTSGFSGNNENPIIKTKFEINRSLDCLAPEIKALIKKFVEETVSCFSRRYRPHPIEVNKAIEEAHKRYCILHRMSNYIQIILKNNSKKYFQLPFELKF